MERIVEDFCELVQLDASSKNERAIADRVKTMMKDLGMTVMEDDAGSAIGGNTGNLIGFMQGELDAEPIMFCAHMDRVANGIGIKPIIEGDRIVSGGQTILAADDVAGIVAILNGILKLKTEGAETGPVEVIFTVCEEKGIEGSKYLDYGMIKSKMAFVMDSSGRIGRIVNQGVSKKTFTIRFRGKSSHAGNEPEKGISAIRGAADFLASINEGRIDSNTTVNFGMIHGGTSTNVICDYVEITGEIRSLEEQKIILYEAYLEEKIEQAKAKRKVGVEFKSIWNYSKFFVSEDERISRLIAKSMEDLGVRPSFEKGGGGMDANRFNNHGIKALGVGTGYLRNHTFDEEIMIRDLKTSADLVAGIINNVSKV